MTTKRTIKIVFLVLFTLLVFVIYTFFHNIQLQSGKKELENELQKYGQTFKNVQMGVFFRRESHIWPDTVVISGTVPSKNDLDLLVKEIENQKNIYFINIVKISTNFVDK